MKISRLLSLAALVFAAGCENDGVVRQPPTELRIFHAASNFENLSVDREQIQLVIMSYGDGIATSFDSGQYDFFVNYQPVGVSTIETLFSFSETLLPELDYTFILLTTSGQPGVFIVSTDDVPPSETTARLTIAHAFEGRGDIDVYVEPAGTDLTTVAPKTTISYNVNPSAFEANPGTNQIYLTAAGDPTDIIFESFPLGFNAGQDEVYVVSDPGSFGTIDIQVSRVSAPTGRIGAIGEESRLRVIQAIDDRLDRDIYLDDTLTPPLFPAQPFGVVSNYENAAVTLHPVITTPVATPGTEEDSQDYFALPGRLFTALITGNSVDGVTTQVISEDKRSIDGEGALRIFNGAGLFGFVDVYLEVPGTDITTQNPFLFLDVGSATERLRLGPDDYEVSIVDIDTQTTLAGPELITIEDGGVYGLLLVNAADGNTVDFVRFDDFTP